MTRTTNSILLVPAVLRDCCDGAAEIGTSAPDVRALLDQLQARHPKLYSSVCDETGRVRRHVNVFVNADHVRDRKGLDTPLAQGDIVSILPAVSGG
jgi:MoaD family protein